MNAGDRFLKQKWDQAAKEADTITVEVDGERHDVTDPSAEQLGYDSSDTERVVIGKSLQIAGINSDKVVYLSDER